MVPLLARSLVPAVFAVSLLPGAAFAQLALWGTPAPRSVLAAKQAAIPSRRSEVASGASLTGFSTISKGTSVTMPLVSGKSVSGTVTFKYSDASGDETIAGTLPDSSHSVFSIRKQNSKVTGLIRVRSTRKAYKVEGWTFGQIEITEMPLYEVECVDYPLPPAQAAAPSPAPAAGKAAAPVKTQPIFSSKPDAPYVLFIDFDGATITDPGWEGGRTLVAEPANMTEDQMQQAWAGVAEDYAFLNINVTTSQGVFNKTDPARRVRCVVTPSAFANAGGIALSGTFGTVDNARSDLSTVCWSFNNTDPKNVADTVAHEVGHTLDMAHDGTITPPGDDPKNHEYFGGHNGWAPIMGVGYGVPLTQWSKGEYQDANNTQDDLAVMAAKVGIGFAVDDFRGTIEGADNIQAPTGKVEQTGVITDSSDVDYFHIPANTGAINVTASPSSFFPDLKLELALFNAGGKEIAVSDTSSASLSASLKRNVNAGDYYLRVRSVGYLNPLTDGYSSYASLGAYRISGKIPGRSVPVGELQPDLIAGRGPARIGAGVTGRTNQKYHVTLGKRKRVKVSVVVANIGFAEEIFKLKKVGHFSGHKYSVIFQGKDVTRPFKKGKLKTKSLARGQKQPLLFVFDVKRSMKKTQTLTVDAVSTIDKSRTDRIAITLEPST